MKKILFATEIAMHRNGLAAAGAAFGLGALLLAQQRRGRIKLEEKVRA